MNSENHESSERSKRSSSTARDSFMPAHFEESEPGGKSVG